MGVVKDSSVPRSTKTSVRQAVRQAVRRVSAQLIFGSQQQVVCSPSRPSSKDGEKMEVPSPDRN